MDQRALGEVGLKMRMGTGCADKGCSSSKGLGSSWGCLQELPGPEHRSTDRREFKWQPPCQPSLPRRPGTFPCSPPHPPHPTWGKGRHNAIHVPVHSLSPVAAKPPGTDLATRPQAPHLPPEARKACTAQEGPRKGSSKFVLVTICFLTETSRSR